MDISKNIYLIFNFINNNIFIDNKIIFISLLIKIFFFYILIKNNLISIFFYFKNFLNKTINKKNRKIVFLISIIIFLNILFYNLIDLIPINIFKFFFSIDNLNITPTSNINITFCFSFISFIIIIFLSIKKNNLYNFIIFFLKNPINNKYMFFFNFIIEFISLVMKPISLSLRLFGNIFSSEIIFNLISNTNVLLNIILNFIWSSFHLFILPLQAFIFITLVIIYISQSLKH